MARFAWLLLIGFALILAACARPTSSTANYQAAQAEVVYVKAAHAKDTIRWLSPPIIIALSTYGGFQSAMSAWSSAPDFLLYSDGRVIVSRWDYNRERPTLLVRESVLNPSEMCTLLNQIDADGFFDFRLGDYIPPDITDSATTHLAVRAWRHRDRHYTDLDAAVRRFRETTDGFVPPALVATYQRLISYEPPRSQPYQPERIALLIEPYPYQDIEKPVTNWPMSNPSIASLMERSNLEQNWYDSYEIENSRGVLIEGPEVTDIVPLFDNEEVKFFSEDNQVYWIALRPLLPLEEWTPPDGRSNPSHFPTEPKTQLSCPLEASNVNP